MQFNYNEWLWHNQTEEELISIINSGGLESYKARAEQELNKRKQEQKEFTEL
jgi:hypothetical protein